MAVRTHSSSNHGRQNSKRVLQCTVQYCAVLYCIVLYCTLYSESISNSLQRTHFKFISNSSLVPNVRNMHVSYAKCCSKVSYAKTLGEGYQRPAWLTSEKDLSFGVFMAILRSHLSPSLPSAFPPNNIMGSYFIADMPRCNRCWWSPTWVFYVPDSDDDWEENPSQVCLACRTAELALGPPAWLRLYSMPALTVDINMHIASYLHPDLHNIWCRTYIRLILTGPRATPFRSLQWDSASRSMAVLKDKEGKRYVDKEIFDLILEFACPTTAQP